MKPFWFEFEAPCGLLSRALVQRSRRNRWKLPEDTCWSVIIRLVTPTLGHAKAAEIRSQRFVRSSLALMIRK